MGRTLHPFIGSEQSNEPAILLSVENGKLLCRAIDASDKEQTRGLVKFPMSVWVTDPSVGNGQEESAKEADNQEGD